MDSNVISGTAVEATPIGPPAFAKAAVGPVEFLDGLSYSTAIAFAVMPACLSRRKQAKTDRRVPRMQNFNR